MEKFIGDKAGRLTIVSRDVRSYTTNGFSRIREKGMFSVGETGSRTSPRRSLIHFQFLRFLSVRVIVPDISQNNQIIS